MSTAFGVNVIAIPPGYSSGAALPRPPGGALLRPPRVASSIEFGDGSTHELREGGAARVVRLHRPQGANLSDSEDAVYLVVGGEDGYVGRDGRLPEGERPAAATAARRRYFLA